MIKPKFYTKAEAEKQKRTIDKTPLRSVDGKSICTVGFTFKYKRGKYLVLRSTSITNLESFVTTYTISYLDKTFSGSSTEECLLKIVAYLTGVILDGV